MEMSGVGRQRAVRKDRWECPLPQDSGIGPKSHAVDHSKHYPCHESTMPHSRLTHGDG